MALLVVTIAQLSSELLVDADARPLYTRRAMGPHQERDPRRSWQKSINSTWIHLAWPQLVLLLLFSNAAAEAVTTKAAPMEGMLGRVLLGVCALFNDHHYYQKEGGFCYYNSVPVR